VARLGVILLLTLLVAAALWAGVWGAASGFALYGDALARGSAGDRERLERALHAYDWAARLDGLDPDYPQRRGRMLEWMAQADAAAPGYSLDGLDAALALYREAAARRPSWPYVSVDIARVKLRLGLLDDELRAHIRWAWRCGAWSPRVQIELLSIGFAAWPLLDAETRAFFDGVLGRALETQPRQAANLALDSGRRDLLEPRAESDERLRQILDRAASAARSEGRR
jgi:hypothetical protein